MSQKKKRENEWGKENGILLPHNVLLQTAQPFFSSLEYVIILADREAKIVFCDAGVLVGVKFCWRNGCHTNLLDEKPGKFEITRTAGYMRRERIILGEFNRGQVSQDKVTTLGVRVLNGAMLAQPRKLGVRKQVQIGAYRNAQLIKDFAEEAHLPSHILPAFIPKPNFVCLLEGNGSPLLEGGDAAIAYPSVSSSHIFDKMLWTNEISNAPTSGIEGLSSRANSESALIHFW